jgi:NAD(P)H-nitrite reductase large subunit
MCCKKKQAAKTNPVEDYKVCGCVNIWYEHIVREIKAGAHTLEQLRDKTGVSTGCGGCTNAVKSILAEQLAQNCK